MRLKFEKLTIWTCTETYGHGIAALDYVMPALKEMEAECKVLDYSTEDYDLVPKQKEE
jgi:hypothetical protein